MSLYQRVRPASFDEVVGNADVVANLRALTAQDNPPDAYLLIGPSGCGKTSISRIIARALGISVEDVESRTGDYREVDSADFRGIDTVREIRHGAAYVGLHGLRRVWLIDECAKLTNDAQNALLKGLEDPPSHCFFVLATTEPEKLLETIRSRCSVHAVSPLSEPDMARLLHKVATAEGGRLARPQLRAIWEKTEGKPRAAIQMLEKCLAAAPEARDALIAAAEAVREATGNLAQALIQSRGWREVAGILAGIEDNDVESVRRGLLGYASKALLGGENERAMIVLDQMVEPFFQSGRAGLVHACYMIVRG